MRKAIKTNPYGLIVAMCAIPVIVIALLNGKWELALWAGNTVIAWVAYYGQLAANLTAQDNNWGRG